MRITDSPKDPFWTRAAEAVTDTQLERAVVVTALVDKPLQADIYLADGACDDPEKWIELATTLDNLADFARRQAHMRKK